MIKPSVNWVSLIALSLVTAASNITPVKAETINFSNEYDFSTSVSTVPEQNLVIGPGEGISNNAEFGLNRFTSLVYGNLSETVAGSANGTPFKYYSDPAVLGVQQPLGGITFFGQGNDRLFGTLNGTNTVDPNTLITKTLGNITITGGEGRFAGATGTGSTDGNFTLNLYQEVNTGKVLVNLKIVTSKSVPENMSAASIALAALAGGLLVAKKTGKETVFGKTGSVTKSISASIS